MFDDTKVIDGYPGKGITMARRKGDIWWVASMTSSDGGTASIPMSFLDPDRKYTAEIYTDGGDKVKTRTHVKTSTRKVSAKDTLKFDLMPRGGVAIRVIPD